MTGSLPQSPKISTSKEGPAGSSGDALSPQTGNGEEAPIGRLTSRQFWGCLALSVTIFVFSTGPVWRHPWDVGVLNYAIFVSYIPIPLLVIACLAWNRTLSLRGFFLDTLVLTLIKYSITFSLALGLWIVAPEPEGLQVAHGARFPVTMTEPAPTPSIINAAETGSLSGVVTDASGRPAEGALVFIASGLEKLVFAAPEEPLLLENNGTGISPRVAVARLRQPIQAKSTDGHLHTFIASRDGTALFNTPLLPSGTWTSVGLRDAGLLTVHCSVHQHAKTEAAAHLAVLDHPFYGFTGADGRFRFNAVPAASLRVTAFHPELGTVTQDARLEAGAAPELSLSLVKRQ